jgi:hypothetical protein
VEQRKGGFWMFGSHSFKGKEIEERCRAGAGEIAIGTGTNWQAGLSREARGHAEQAQLELHTLPSYEAAP